MTLTEKFRTAGTIAERTSGGWTDEDLKLLSEVHELVLEYLHARGSSFDLATNRIRQDAHAFQDMEWRRRLDKQQGV